MGGEINLDDSTIFLCSTCKENFREPYVLKCLHTFCRGCLKQQKEDKESVICESCEQETRVNVMRQNCFLANSLASSLLQDFRKGNIHCGNCSTKNRLLKYCKECMEYLCDPCAYYHENTKLTRAHSLIPLDIFEEALVTHGENRAVFCPAHEDNIVEEYCQSCEETICRGCEVHQEHNAVSVAEASSTEVPHLKAVLERAISKVGSHEECASRCCSLVDELRDRKGELCDKVKAYFIEYKEKVQKHEEQLLQEILNWYNKQFELIKLAQKKEEQRIAKISDALRFSKILLKHGTDAEILSLRHLIQSKLNRLVNQKSSTTFIAAVETAIRNASWKLLAEQLTQKKQSNGLTLPEVNEGFESDDENDDVSIAGPVVEDENGQNDCLQEEDQIRLRRANSGVEGKDFQLGSILSRENRKIWYEGRQIARDYRYDKILRNRSIGRPGTGYGEFQHPCGIAVDYKHDDRLIVSDFNNNRVQVFSYFGEFLFHFGTRGCSAGQFNGPTGVAVLYDGSIAVCDCLNNRVQLFTSEGVFVSAFGCEGRSEGEFWRPMGIAVDSQDRIVVVDQGNNRVQVFNKEGEVQFTFGKLGKWDGEISCPNFVAVDKDDNIYVSDEINMRVQIFRPDGSYWRKISAKEIHGFQGNVDLLSGIAVDSRGYVVVGVKSSCSARVFTPDGRFLRAFSSSRAFSSRLLFASGIALTSAGEIVVSDWFNNRIRFF